MLLGAKHVGRFWFFSICDDHPQWFEGVFSTTSPAIEPRICCWDFHVFAQSKLMIGRPKQLTETQLRFAWQDLAVPKIFVNLSAQDYPSFWKPIGHPIWEAIPAVSIQIVWCLVIKHGLIEKVPIYPLVNKHSYYSGFTHWKLWFFIFMLVYQRVVPCFPHLNVHFVHGFPRWGVVTRALERSTEFAWQLRGSIQQSYVYQCSSSPQFFFP